MLTIGGQAPARPWWKRAAGRVLKRGLAWRYRHFRPGGEPARWARVAGLRLRVLPGVFHPGRHFTSGFLAAYLGQPGVIPPGARVADLGTGSGIAAIAAARAGAGRVVATDIHPAAARCAAANAGRYGLQGRIQVRQGDLFAPLAGERFDVLICNPPYFRGTPRTLAEQAYLGGPAYEWLDRFAAGAAAHLAPGGRILLVLGDAADIPTILAHLAAPGWQITPVARRDLLIEVLYIYALVPRQDPDTALVGQMRCPACGGSLLYRPAGAKTPDAEARCGACGAGYPRRAGVWRMLTEAQEEQYRPFLEGYRSLRQREGWERPAAYYLRLPDVARDDPSAAMWRIRRRSLRQVEAALEPGAGRPALDLGAGNGWLARRLAARGFAPVAADLNPAGIEGLEGGALYLQTGDAWFSRVQASMDGLPFADGTFALCTISGALYYADLERTLQAVWRVLVPGGRLIISDSPIYTQEAAGRAMVRELEARIRTGLGHEPPPLPGGTGFLVEATLLAALRGTGFVVQVRPIDRPLSRVKRGVLRRLRPGRREEARFPVIVADKPGGAAGR